MNTTTLTLEQIARTCYGAIQGYNNAIGFPADPAWEDAPQELRDHYMQGVEMILENANYEPRDQQEAWVERKKRAGWVFGHTKDRNATPPTHPCILPWNELPRMQQRKDEIFVAMVRVMVN